MATVKDLKPKWLRDREELSRGEAKFPDGITRGVYPPLGQPELKEPQVIPGEKCENKDCGCQSIGKEQATWSINPDSVVYSNGTGDYFQGLEALDPTAYVAGSISPMGTVRTVVGNYGVEPANAGGSLTLGGLQNAYQNAGTISPNFYAPVRHGKLTKIK